MPNSATSSSFPPTSASRSFDDGYHHPPSANRPMFGGQSLSPQTSLTHTQLGPASQQTNLTAVPHPDAAPFIPNGQPYEHPRIKHSNSPSLLGGINGPHIQHEEGAQIPHTSSDHPPFSYRVGSSQSLQRPRDDDFDSRLALPYHRITSTGEPFPPRTALNTSQGDPTRAAFPAFMEPSNASMSSLPPLNGPSIAPPQAFRSHTEALTFPQESMTSFPDPQTFFMVGMYLHDQFGNPELADCVLRISHSQQNFPAFSLAAHLIVLARSPKFRSLVKSQNEMHFNAQTLQKELIISISDRFLNNKFAFNKALRRLYAGELPDPHFVSKAIGYGSSVECMQFALSFAASGHYLQIDEIVNRGLELASKYLNYETLGKALAFALDGGIGPSWYPQGASEDSSPSSSQSAHVKIGSLTATPTYGIYSDRILYQILGFITQALSPQFTLNIRAAQLADCPRLPESIGQRPARSNSRLTQIRFGEMSLSDQELEKDHSQIISSVLLSLPYILLKHLLEHEILTGRVGQARVSELMQAVIGEREERRQAAMRQYGHQEPPSMGEESQWRNLCWAEGVERSQQHPCGYRLSRHHLGAATPTSGKS